MRQAVTYGNNILASAKTISTSFSYDLILKPLFNSPKPVKYLHEIPLSIFSISHNTILRNPHSIDDTLISRGSSKQHCILTLVSHQFPITSSKLALPVKGSVPAPMLNTY
jgi:hypothetical protein